MSYLKIDGDFITTLVDSEIDRLMVKAIVQTARGMGIMTIAEFVGEDATQRLPREFGVDMAQGYHIGRPVDASGLTPSLAAQRRYAG